MNVSNGMLARLTAAKAISNISFRWLAFFLPTLVIALDSTTQQLTTILGVGEMAGLVTVVVGRYLDQNRERLIIVLSLAATSVALLLAATGSIVTFAIGNLIIMIGVALSSAGGHTYLGRRVLYQRRARAIGIFETSWASGLLIGAPIAALLISAFGWRGPLIVFAVASAVVAVVLWMAEDSAVLLDDALPPVTSAKPRLTAKAYLTVAASAFIAITGLTTVVIAGTWLTEAFRLSTGGIGFIAMLFGSAEMLATTSSAAVADQVGPVKSTRYALVVVLIGLIVMTQAGSSLAVGALGLFMFFVGFEFAIVTSFSIVSEAMPTARGRVLAVNGAVGTLFRGFGISVSGILYVTYGIAGPAGLSLTTAVIALALLVVLSRQSNVADTISVNA